MDPLLERAEALLDEPREPAEQLRALVRLWVEHVVAHRDHMLVFQQERHVIERGAAWRGVRASRKAFERLAEDALGQAVAGAGIRPPAGALRRCSGWSTTRRSGTARAAASGPPRSPTATSTSF